MNDVLKDVSWISLVSSLQRGSCVLVLGPDIPAVQRSDAAGAAGVMKAVRDALCEDLAAMLDMGQKAGEPVLFEIAQHFVDRYSSRALQNIAADYIARADFEPGPLHKLLASLPFSLVVTTCHDELFAKALKLQGKPPSRTWYHFKGEPREIFGIEGTPSHDAPAVYQLFGACDQPASLVLTENDLLDFTKRVISKPGLPNSLLTQLRNKTYLFVGFGIRHWYIRVLLKLLIRTLELFEDSVAIESFDELHLKEFDQTVAFYQRGHRVEVVNMEAVGFVQELTKRFGGKGGYLGPVQNLLPPVRVFISYERSDGEIAMRLNKALPPDRFDVWLDRTRLEGGEVWDQEIEDKIRASDFFLVLNSRNLVGKDSGYVNKELSIARDAQSYRKAGAKFILPLLVDGLSAVEGEKDLRMFHQLDLRSDSFADDVLQIRRTMVKNIPCRSP